MAYQTATNTETGAKIIKIDGAWVPVEKSATGADGAKAYKVGGKWLTEPSAEIAPEAPQETRQEIERRLFAARQAQMAETARTGRAPPAKSTFGEASMEIGKTGVGLGEVALQGLTGLVSSIAGGVPAAATAALGGNLDELANSIREVQEAGTYQPRTDAGKALSGIVALPAEGTNFVGEQTAEATGSPLAGTAVKTGLDAALMAIGMRGAKPSAGGIRTGALKDVADLFSEKGHERLATKAQQKLVGERPRQLEVADALDKVEELVPGSKPTAADAVATLPSGSPILASQNAVARSPGGPSARFGERANERAAAVAAEKKARDQATAPMREKALDEANEKGAAGVTVSKLPPTQKPIFNPAEKTVKIHSDNGVTEARVRGGDTIQIVDTKTLPGAQGGGENPARIAALADFAEKSGARLTSDTRVRETAARAYDKLEALGYEVKRNPATKDVDGYLVSDTGRPVFEVRAPSTAPAPLKGMKADSVVDRIVALEDRPGVRASEVVAKTLGSVKEKITSLMDQHGLIDARDLYTVRKEIGNTVKTFSKETANWDKRLTSGLERDVQRAIDDAIEAAGGTGWKDYLTEYSKRSEGLSKETARTKAISKPAQRTNVSGVEGAAGAARPHIPNLLSRPAMIVNAILRKISGDVEVKLTNIMADRYLNPKKLAEALRQETSPSTRVRPRVSSMAVSTAVSPEERKRRLQAEALRNK